MLFIVPGNNKTPINAMSAEQPVTERANPLSVNIDVSTPPDIISILQKCDEEIFSGWQNYPGMFDAKILETITAIASKAVEIMKIGNRGAIVISGCGTSGRLGFITTRTFNIKLKSVGQEPCCHYIMAGGDRALFTSQEAVEDDPPCGMDVLNKVCKDKERVLFIGITCGLSAPFVAGQLYLCMEQPSKYIPVLLGFNPTSLARNLPIEKWDKTFRQVVQRLETDPNGYILNPVVGPEQITGSSRMKSGSATKILLEAVLVTAYLKTRNDKDVRVQDLLRSYHIVCDSVYSRKAEIANIVELAGKSLKAGGHIYYVAQDSLGIMGMIDASECPPTYGATLDDIRGFVATGFDFLMNNDGDISDQGKHFRISLANFQDEVAPTVSTDDLVVVLLQDTSSIPCVEGLSCRKACVVIGSEQTKVDPLKLEQFAAVVQVSLPSISLAGVVGETVVTEFWQLYREIAVKWVLNATTTGGHILKGKVVQNIMVDVKVSNNKLFYRAVGIIQHYSKLSQSAAQDYLLRSIYNTDSVTTQIQIAPVAEHIQRATPQQRVVPIALIAAVCQCSITQAQEKLDSQPIIRSIIQVSLEKKRIE
ncbi:glucokinase regulatory protein-like [Haliotis asinina]|uniref:glucokinase regulatory protein-like n=1 Tax=Haliotis asinina TaxID=109174 RepID=UPI003531DD83